MQPLVTVNNLTHPIASPARVGYCDSFACKLRGLMFRTNLGPDEGLLLVEGKNSRLTSSIHMLFVPFDLAVFWIDANRIVVDKVLARSWRPAYFPRAAAKYTLELHAGRFAEYQIGDGIEIHAA